MLAAKIMMTILFLTERLRLLLQACQQDIPELKYEITQGNALITFDFISALKTEINLSGNYRRSNIERLIFYCNVGWGVHYERLSRHLYSAQ